MPMPMHAHPAYMHTLACHTCPPLQTDHEKHLQRARAAELAEASGSAAPAEAVDPAVASLHRSTGDLSLKEGQTIRWGAGLAGLAGQRRQGWQRWSSMRIRA